jgi:hypothetical protein
MHPAELPESFTFCGRRFVRSELELMRQIAAEFAGLGRTEIARTLCELLEWKRPSGGLKNYECRQLLERLAEQGWCACRRCGRWGRAGRAGYR